MIKRFIIIISFVSLTTYVKAQIYLIDNQSDTVELAIERIVYITVNSGEKFACRNTMRENDSIYFMTRKWRSYDYYIFSHLDFDSNDTEELNLSFHKDEITCIETTRVPYSKYIKKLDRQKRMETGKGFFILWAGVVTVIEYFDHGLESSLLVVGGTGVVIGLNYLLGHNRRTNRFIINDEYRFI